MSALDGWIDVCRAGTWRDMAGRDVAIDEARLDRIVDAHAVADPATVVVGHPETERTGLSPGSTGSAASATGCRRSSAISRRPSARRSRPAATYAGRSIALQGDTLRHVGFLGGQRTGGVGACADPLRVRARDGGRVC